MNSRKNAKTEFTEENFNSAMIYTNNNRFFSSLTYEDVKKIKNWRNQQMEILRQWKPLTDYNQEQWFEKISTDPTQVTFSIHWLNSNNELELIGYCGIVNIDFINRRGEVSFIIDTKRNGNLTLFHEDFEAALNILCNFGFQSLNLNKLFTETYDFRDEILNALVEFGFTSEGILRSHNFIDGNYSDSIIHSILLEEWLKK